MSKFIVKHAAVLGAGVMGAQIAAHLANAGVRVTLYDLTAKEGDRNGVARKALEGLKKLEPAPLAGLARLGLLLLERRPMSWDGVGQMPQPLRQADLHLSYPLRLGAMPVRAALTVRQLNGTQVLFESRFARPTSRRQMYASVDVGF